MTEFSHIVYEIVIWFFLLYACGVVLVYSWMGIYALGAVLRYKRENTFTDYSIIASNPNAPVFSLIAPAYNEGMTIVENVRSLLSLYYHNLEIIIVNDGSKDDSIQKLIEAYELESVNFFIQGNIPTAEVRGIYKSKNPAFRKLTVVDKANGGKADALNVGVNISGGDYLVCIDVDCILEQDAILKLAKPFLEQTDKKLIACGGVIRLANNCRIENGKVVEVNLPRTLLGRTQVLEYIRAFVLGRMAWSRASGLILISGAFGVFDRKIVLACGGYDKNTVGEDMELVVRMRQYMEERNEPYEVINIPDPLCWTEAPESKEILVKQRNRWMRGTMETLWKHRKMMFNPRYGKLGTVSLPYWFTFEFLGPLIEFAGYFIFVIFLLLGIINWSFFWILFALVISAGFLYSIYAILVDLVSRQVYTKRKDFMSLITTALLEPFYFHPIVVRAGVKGFVDYFKKSHSWGEMTRQGFSQETKNLPLAKRLLAMVTFALRSWGVAALVLILFFMIAVGAEWAWYGYSEDSLNTERIVGNLFLDNTLFLFKMLFGLGIIYLIVYLVNGRWARNLALVLFSGMVIFQFVLFIYFSESGSLLGADVQYYDREEMKQTLQASGMLNLKNIALGIILTAVAVVPFLFAGRSTLKSPAAGLIILGLGLVALFIPRQAFVLRDANEFEQNAAKSKWEYFFSSNISNIISQNPEITRLLGKPETFASHSEMLDKDYPFWKKEDTRDFLGPMFNKSERVPNLVLVVMEGFGNAYTTPRGYIGNFAPFLDSLAGKGLYWENALSSTGARSAHFQRLRDLYLLEITASWKWIKRLPISIFIMC
ncbi:glycosyl transferase, family 2 [Flavobacteriaceae bacterium 3519-10]|nr:glycosyl transferase, family 2 [Flavobacteriaceae bacterium 3519-10]